MKLFVGIDISSKSLDSSFMTSESNKEIKRGSYDNDLIGANELKLEILKLDKEYHLEKVIVGMESTSIYSFHPAYFFQNDQDLSGLNTESVVLNPKETKRYKGIFEESKTDSIDAFYIADYLRSGHFTTGIVRQEKYVALQRLTRTRYDVVKNLGRAKQHFIENLYYSTNKLASSDFETSVFGSTMMELLTDDVTPDEIAQLPLNELANYLNVHGHGRFADPEKLASAIQKAIRGSYRLDKTIQNSIDVVMATYASEIRAFQASIKSLDKEIEKIVTVIPESKILLSMPGIGPVYSAGILAEIGQIERFEDETKLAKYAGLAWKQNQSGNFKGDVTPRAHTGNAYLRYYLIEAANSVVRHEPTFKSYFEKKKSEVTRSPRKRALVLTARKLIRVIFYLLTNHQIYKVEESV